MRAYRVVIHNTPSPIDIAQMAQIRRDAICQSKPMAKYLQKTCLDTLPCEPTMRLVCTCVRQPDKHGILYMAMPIRYTPIAIGSLWGLPGGCDSQSSFHRGITAHPAGHHALAPETEAVAGRCVNRIGMLRSSLRGDRTSIMAWHRQTQSIWIPLVLYTYFGTWGHLVFCSCASAH